MCALPDLSQRLLTLLRRATKVYYMIYNPVCLVIILNNRGNQGSPNPPPFLMFSQRRRVRKGTLVPYFICPNKK
jgi:hypothetical protein